SFSSRRRSSTHTQQRRCVHFRAASKQGRTSMKFFVQQGDNLVLFLWGIALYIHFMSALAFEGVSHSKGWRGSKPRGLAHRRFTAPPDDGEAVGICFDGGCSLEHGEVKLEPKSLDDDDSSVQVPP
ncbi:unnamed protein product, partial [Heterosigma akashiwo]